jgi:DNA replication protein DnaC
MEVEQVEWKKPHDLPGDPNCPTCGGIGYFRYDLPVGHPDFGKVQICACRNQEISQQVHDRLFALSNLDELDNLTFENFLPRGQVGLRSVQADSLELAYNQARQFAQSLKGWLLLQEVMAVGRPICRSHRQLRGRVGVPTLPYRPRPARHAALHLR